MDNNGYFTSKNKQKIIDNSTITKIRENNKLKLRKDKIRSYLMTSRMTEIQSLMINSTDYEIKKDTLQLPSEFKLEYDSSNTQFHLAISNLSSKDINIIKFCLWHLHNHFKDSLTNDDNSIDRLILPSTIHDLISILYTYGSKDKTIIYEVTWLFIQFSITSKTLPLQIANDSLIQVLFGVLTSKDIDYCLMNNVIILFIDWLRDDKLYKLVTTNCNIVGFIFQVLKTSDKSNFPMAFLINCLKCLLFLLNESTFPLLIPYIESHISFIVKFVISDLNHLLFTTALKVLNKIFSLADEDNVSLAKIIDELGLIHVIGQHINIKEDNNEEAEEVEEVEEAEDAEEIYMICFMIFIDLTYIDNSLIVKIIFNTYLIGKVYSILEKMTTSANNNTQSKFKYKSLLGYITDLIRNLISLNSVMDYLIKKSTAIFRMLIVLLQKDINKNEYVSIMNVFNTIILGAEKSLYLELIYLEVPNKVILYTLSSNKDEESKSISLFIAHSLLDFGKDLVQGQNFIKRHFDTIGLSTMIESYTNCNSTMIAEHAEEICKKYYANNIND